MLPPLILFWECFQEQVEAPAGVEPASKALQASVWPLYQGATLGHYRENREKARKNYGREDYLFSTMESREEFLILGWILIETEGYMENKYFCSANFRSLEEFHSLARCIISSFEYIYSRSITIIKRNDIILKFCIFEIVFRCLNIILFTIWERSNGNIKTILHNKHILRKTIFYLRWNSSEYNHSTIWVWKICIFNLIPCCRIGNTKTSTNILWRSIYFYFNLSPWKTTWNKSKQRAENKKGKSWNCHTKIFLKYGE